MIARWFALLCATVAASAALAAGPATRPNVVLILADDMGYSDLGCYGGEIATPNLDRLAREGARFSQFRVEPMCTVSRVSMLAGMPFSLAGGTRYDGAVPFPRLLREAGYTTALVGKWHAGSPNPRDGTVFDEFYGFLGGMTDCFSGGDDWFDGRRRITQFPKDFYSTRAFGDRAADFIDRSARAGKPFFAYVAFNAPHHPVQAPKTTVEKYAHTYDAGYEAIRAARRERQVKMGLIDASWPDAPTDATVRRWSDLDAKRQRIESDRMAAYAAMVDEVDQAVGRICDALRAAGVADDTLVLFASDNGADYNNGSLRTDAQQVPWVAGSNVTSDNEWARVKNAPFRSFKHSCFEGALASPLLVRWPGGMRREANAIIREPAHITDFYPTLLELAGVAIPTEIDGKPLRAPTGRSLAPLLTAKGKAAAAPPMFSWYDFSASFQDGDWKIARLYDGPWQLFDLKRDRGESRDLAAEQPERVQTLARAFADYAKGTNVRDAKPVAQRGWGWHRLEMATGQHIVSATPENGAIVDTLTPTISIAFDVPAKVTGDGTKRVRVFRVDREDQPIWERSASELKLEDGARRIVFDGLPTLAPDTSYFVEWPPGLVTLGGKPIGGLNDGAFWWRFRTAPDAR